MAEINKFGIGFWAGVAVYSLISLIQNYIGAAHSRLILYDYIILGASAVGLVLNIFLLMHKRK